MTDPANQNSIPNVNDAPQPGYPVQHGSAPQPRFGMSSWLQFLWLYLPIPLLNVAAYLIATIVMRSKNKLEGSVAEANSRHALNWALTYVSVLGLLGVIGASSMAIGSAASSTGSVSDGNPALIPWIIFVVSIFLFGIMTMVNCVTGAVIANRRRVHNPWVTIPFLRGAAGSDESVDVDASEGRPHDGQSAMR